MSHSMNFSGGAVDGRDATQLAFSGRIAPGVILFDEAIPIPVFTWASTLIPDGVLDPCLARWAGATLAMRSKDEQAIRVRAGFQERYRKQIERIVADHSIDPGVSDWLAGDHVGMSSLAILFRLTSLTPRDVFWGASEVSDSSLTATPSDPSDFRRCLLLLDAAPSLASRLSSMSAVSSGWEKIVRHWDSISQAFERECPDWRNGFESAPETYNLLRAMKETD